MGHRDRSLVPEKWRDSKMMKVNVELPEVLPANKEDFMKLLLELVVKK